jgi:superfamily I DNA and/or RNA helicase
VTAKDRAHNLPDPWTNKAIAFVDVDGKSMGYEERGQSKSRKAEVTKVMNILDKIIQYDKNLSVGVITFYSKQVRELMRAAEKKGYTQLDREGNYIISPMYSTTTNGRERLRIGSVDSFQGKEFDVVILSTVRSNNTERKESNERKAFGFLLLENRLNVAFSRAIRLLITVGDGSMFNDDFAKNHVKGLYELYTHQTKLQYGVLIK